MTGRVKVASLDWKVPMVEPASGRPSPSFQRYWQNVIQPLFNTVTANLSPGWVAATGTPSTATFVTYTAPAISNPPTQAQVQAIADHLQVLSQHMKSLIDAGLLSGLLTD